jgi:glycosyltransferase involved in cell wall biosynthesis
MRPRRIVYIQYANPVMYPPLQHSSRILADAGWDVLFLGIGAFGDLNSLRFRSYPRIEVRQLQFCTAGWKQKLHYAWFCMWCLAWALWWRPQWVYASDVLACPPALLLSWVLRLRIVYHEHDSDGRATSMFMQLCIRARRACARRASICVLPNAHRAERFKVHNRPKKSVKVVWNCPELREVAATPNGKTGTGLRVLYHGNVSPVLLPLTVIEALALLPEDVSLTIVGYETIQGYTQALLARAEQLGVRGRVHCLGPMSRFDLMETCATCHVGLALIPLTNDNANLQALTGASNKSFDYLACGLAVLVSDLPDWREMFVEPGYGLSCNPGDPVTIAAALRRFYEHPGDSMLMGEQGRKRILAEWNYEAQFQPVLQELVTS